jgi:phenylalanyl-tRNA synthetase alpha subunit
VDRVQEGPDGKRGVSTANLIHTMKTCLRVILERDVEVRLRPGFFPFVAPRTASRSRRLTAKNESSTTRIC